MKKRLLSCITALGLAVCSLSAISSNAYYWGIYDASSKEETANFNKMIENLIPVEDGGIFTPSELGIKEKCYIYPDTNLFLVTLRGKSHINVYISDKDNREILKNIVEQYNSDNGTDIVYSNNAEYCDLYFYNVPLDDIAAKELTLLIKEKQIAENIVYRSNLKTWQTGYFDADSILTYYISNGEIDNLKEVEEYFIENEIDYRYDSEGKIIGGENLSKIEQMEMAVDIYKTTGARIFHLYLMNINPYYNDGDIDLMNAVAGDANEDEELDMADAVLIMQSLSNPDKYQLTAQGRYNSDFNNDGITNEDALTIQKILLEIE